MSKIICDICGTVYPDTAAVCPICGFPRENSKLVADDENAAGSAAAAEKAYTPVKGGRFSSKNVKKRNQTETKPTEGRRREKEPERERSNRGLVIAAIVLLIAIVLVSIYIGIRFWKGRDAYEETTPSTEPQSTIADTTPTETEPVETGIPCLGISVSDSIVTLTGAGRVWKLGITLMPEDTTDVLTITSSNEDVVDVNEEGLLTAIGPGTATITITCGEVTKTCQIECNFNGETEPVQTTEPSQPTEPAAKGLTLSHTDVTFFGAGESFRLTAKYNGETVSAASVSYQIEDSAIATVASNGKIEAVSGGVTTVTVTYNGESAKCVIRCKFETKPTEETEPDTDGWEISNSDVTLRIGESFTLRLRNAAGETAEVVWSADKSGIVSVSGNRVTGETAGVVTLSASIDGQTYSCIVRVK